MTKKKMIMIIAAAVIFLGCAGTVFLLAFLG